MMFHFVPFLLKAVLHVSIILKGDAVDANCTNVYAAGSNYYGQWGNGADFFGPTESKPVLVETQEGRLLDIATGGRHSAIVKVDGSVWTTGWNVYGQLGHNDTTSRSTFTQVDGLVDITKVHAGYKSTFFITATSEIYATGLNDYGQLGVGDTIDRLVPVKVNITDVVEIASGWKNTLFRKGDGTVYASGWNGYGQLCLGDFLDRMTPVQITSMSGVDEIEAGQLHSVFLTDAGEIWTCGKNWYGQLGLGNNTSSNAPSLVSGFSSVVTSVAATWRSTSFLLADGTVHSTGRNRDGELGVGDYVNRNTPVAVSIDGVADIFGARGSQIFFSRNDGSIWSTGNNWRGELGVGDTTDKNTPNEVVSLADDGVSYVAGGSSFTLFVADGPCPSEAPSSAPSSAPTDTPSVVPSQSLAPTASPTTKPTKEPTEAPTNTPTIAPTNAPTNTPTSGAGISAYPTALLFIVLGTLGLFVFGW